MSSTEEIIVRICRALLREFGSQQIDVPDDISNPVAKEIVKVADKVNVALRVKEQVVEEASEDAVIDYRIGINVEVESKGIRGTIVSRNKGWLVINVTHVYLGDGTNTSDGWEKTESTRTISARWGDCAVIDTRRARKPSAATTPAEESVAEIPESKSDEHIIDRDGPGAYRIEVGIHTGKSIHEIYVDAENGDVFLKYLAKKEGGPYSPEAKTAAQEYLKIRSETK
jgi:hypothetical protein